MRLIVANNPNFKNIMLTKEQIDKLEEIQKSEREKSTLGIAPSIHAIARQLMNQALETYA
jgi:hypothetical protein